MLVAQAISKSFGLNRVLENISFECRPGSMTALVGGNGAGKTTLLKIAGGVLRASSGVAQAGESRQPVISVRGAMASGIRSAYQEGSLIPAWRVKEHFTHTAGFIDTPWKALAPEVPPDAMVEDLRPSERQLLEIARALSHRPKIFLADEPAAGLGQAERSRVYEALADSVRAGCTVLVATHDLNFALNHCDRVLALNKGQLILSRARGDCTLRMVLEAMGAKSEWPSRQNQPDIHNESAEAISVKTPSGTVLFSGRATEVLGITGASLARDTLRSMYGLANTLDFTAYLGERRLPRSPNKLYSHLISYVSRERSTEWNFDGQSLEFNLISATLPKLSRHGLIQRRQAKQRASELKELFQVVAPSLDMDFELLSGGNRQKAVLARAASASPKFLLLDEPFSGVDQPTRVKIFSVLRELALDGMGVVIYSQEVPDLLSATDRIVVLHNDESISQFVSATTTADQIETSVLLSSHRSTPTDLNEQT